MKVKPIYIIFLLLAIFATACGSSDTPTAEVPAVETLAVPVNTEVPPGSGDPVWDRVSSAGKIVIGTSADYAPFEYYNDTFQIVGFDAAIARELGALLGLQVELTDFAFEGLNSALQIGQIDAAIAAISITPARQAVVDFTNVYYSGQDSIIARRGSGIEAIVAPAQLASFRVGVQRGSIYENWLQTNLIDTGLMPAANLLAYAKPEHAVTDLEKNRNDLVVMDTQPAKQYLLKDSLELVGQGLNTQLFAIALPKGSTVLQSQLNTALTQMQNDGTIAALTHQYFDINLTESLPVLKPTAVPGPTATPVACHDGAAFVADITIPDGKHMNPGQEFGKNWRLKNTGTCIWDSSYKLVFVQGDLMQGGEKAIKGTVNSNGEYNITVGLKAPNHPGNYGGLWQMVNEHGVPFGERIWVRINVPGQPKPTAVPPQPTAVPPQPTAVPPQPSAIPPLPVQPTLGTDPVINDFKAIPETVKKGDNVLVSWDFTGANLASATLSRMNPDGTLIALFGGDDIPLQGTYDDMMMITGTYTYTLHVAAEFGANAVETILVNVTK